MGHGCSGCDRCDTALDRSRADALEELTDDTVFAAMVTRIVDRLGITVVADELRVSVRTVDRWMRGVTAPHFGMRPALLSLAARHGL